MSDNDNNIKKRRFEAFVNAIGPETEQAQVRLISAANAQMLFHYWNTGSGFVFVARQKHSQIGDKDFHADLIPYNIKSDTYCSRGTENQSVQTGIHRTVEHLHLKEGHLWQTRYRR